MNTRTLLKGSFIRVLIAGMFLAVVVGSCRKDEDPAEDTGGTNPVYELEYGQLAPPTIPDDNKLTVEGVKLGRMLFYEKALSGDGTQSCADCHRQEHAFSDTAQFSTGIAGMHGKRQAMAVFNTLWHENAFFWDGRAHLLRDQALMPIQDPLEMNETLENVVSKLAAMDLYTAQFQKAFGTDAINPERISLALEQFMNSIVSADSKYDRYLAGKTNLTPSEERGRVLFFAEYNPFFPQESGADCAHCHAGLNFENDRFMNNGLDSGTAITDIGYQNVSGSPADRGRFKVVSLRNVELTPPYMHDGRFRTLEEVVEHYNSAIRDSPTLDPAIRNTMQTGLMLNAQDKQDLVAFLKTLTDHTFIVDPRYSNPH